MYVLTVQTIIKQIYCNIDKQKQTTTISPPLNSWWTGIAAHCWCL